MLCELCKANSATFLSLGTDSGRDLCHDCWQLLAEADRIHKRYPNLAQQHDSMKTFEMSMRELPRLTKKSFEEAIASRKTDYWAFSKNLLQMSCRFIFDEIKKHCSTNFNCSLPSLYMDCLQAMAHKVDVFMSLPQSHMPQFYRQWRKILKIIVRESIEKRNARKT